jgi:phage FluMu protein gp41
MATITAILNTGLTIKDAVHTEAEIREATAADLIEATDESEKVVRTGEGFALLVSHTLVGLNTLRRQIVRVGDYKGPLTLAELKKLSALDLSLLQEKAQQLETATLEEIAARGRHRAGGQADG